MIEGIVVPLSICCVQATSVPVREKVFDDSLLVELVENFVFPSVELSSE